MNEDVGPPDSDEGMPPSSSVNGLGPPIRPTRGNHPAKPPAPVAVPIPWWLMIPLDYPGHHSGHD